MMRAGNNLARELWFNGHTMPLTPELLRATRTFRIALLASLPLLAPPPLFGAGQAHATDPDGIESWEYRGQGVSLRLAQLLPDQVRGFYLARGFDTESVELLAAGACVFQTAFRNESVPGAIEFSLADWRIVTAAGEKPLKLEPEWQQEWERRGVPAAARAAFRFALYPARHRYETGDWNMGMTTYALTPGSRFDLRFVWREHGQRHEALLTGVRCAREGSK